MILQSTGIQLLIFRAFCVLTSGFLLLQAVSPQVPERKFRKMLGLDTWTPEEVTALANGDVVVRHHATAEKQDLSTTGILMIKGLPAISMEKFRESLSQKGGESMKGGGQFSDPPTFDDLMNLELDKDSIEQLRKCTVGNCDLNLSANMIERFAKEIDWNAGDAGQRATNLFQEMLVTFVQNYLGRGIDGLGTFDNRRKTVDLKAAHTSLISNSLFIREIHPNFLQYLEDFPADTLANVQSSMHWSIVDFGLKPSITVSHSAVHTEVTGNEQQHFVASRQIYASRYLDSSLTFSVLLRVSDQNGITTYLVFSDRSRSDALEGPLGGFARGVVQKESAARIKSLLDKVHLRLLYLSRPNETHSTSGAQDSLIDRTLGFAKSRGFALAAVFLVLISLGVAWRWKSRG
jgi:hypothetical protein